MPLSSLLLSLSMAQSLTEMWPLLTGLFPPLGTATDFIFQIDNYKIVVVRKEGKRSSSANLMPQQRPSFRRAALLIDLHSFAAVAAAAAAKSSTEANRLMRPPSLLFGLCATFVAAACCKPS